jgi:hypothetical protein
MKDKRLYRHGKSSDRKELSSVKKFEEADFFTISKSSQELFEVGNLEGLYARRKICDSFIRQLMFMDDPRAPDALEHYRGQLAEIDGKITALEKSERQRLGLPEPEPIVVGLKSATIAGKADLK